LARCYTIVPVGSMGDLAGYTSTMTKVIGKAKSIPTS
jgi:hypothetical protein